MQRGQLQKAVRLVLTVQAHLCQHARKCFQPRHALVVLGHIPAGWGAREVALAESYLRRSAELAPEHSEEIGRRLLALVARAEPERAAEVAHYSDLGLALRRALEVREGAG